MDDNGTGGAGTGGAGRHRRAAVSKAWLQALGRQHYAYVSPLMRKGRKFYVVRAANGEALLACGTLAAAEATAREHGLKVVSLH